MKRKNMTRNALVTSIISMLLCVSMLVGTTFAWFTDSVTSANNIIQSGNLDIELEYWNGTTWVDVSGKSDILTNTLWEPGVTEIAYLRVANAGSLALSYQLGINIVSETAGTNMAGSSFNLSDYIQYGIVEDVNGETGAYANREAAVADITAAKALNEGYYSKPTSLAAGAAPVYLALVVYMPTTVDNDANYKTSDDPSNPEKYRPQIDLGINVYATQFTSESDSFNNQYDAPAVLPDNATVVRSEEELLKALEGDEDIYVAGSFGISKTIDISKNAVIGGNGSVISRAAGFTGTMFNVGSGVSLEVENTVLDGGAVWNGNNRSAMTNNGVVATGNLIATTGNGSIVLNKGAVLQNNDGANAVSLATRGGGSLTVNGASIIYNRSAAGAIWGGGNITINEGSKINYNHATSIGGAIRMVDGKNAITFTMNGGEMNYNTSDSTGGAIWGGNKAKYYFNGGEMAYNTAASAGGAIWTGTYESYYISGDFQMHDNSAGELGGAIRFCDHTSLTMTGGHVYNNTVNGASNAFYLNNNSATITGGKIEDNFSYSGGLGLTLGDADIDGVIHYSLNTNHKTAYLATSFNSFSFTVAEGHEATFNFKPAADYAYTEGDEAKLICMNEGYKTYWDANTKTFRLQATN